MQWFGDPWPSVTERAPVCEDDAQRVEVPVGEPCLWCDEPLTGTSRGVIMPVVVTRGIARVVTHVECHFRQVVGGPAHIRGTCACSGGPDDPDMGMSARQAALTVWHHYTGEDINA